MLLCFGLEEMDMRGAMLEVGSSARDYRAGLSCCAVTVRATRQSMYAELSLRSHCSDVFLK